MSWRLPGAARQFETAYENRSAARRSPGQSNGMPQTAARKWKHRSGKPTALAPRPWCDMHAGIIAFLFSMGSRLGWLEGSPFLTACQVRPDFRFDSLHRLRVVSCAKPAN